MNIEASYSDEHNAVLLGDPAAPISTLTDDEAQALGLGLLHAVAASRGDREMDRELADLVWRIGPGRKLVNYLLEHRRNKTLYLRDVCATIGVDPSNRAMRTRVLAMATGWDFDVVTEPLQ